MNNKEPIKVKLSTIIILFIIIIIIITVGAFFMSRYYDNEMEKVTQTNNKTYII